MQIRASAIVCAVRPHGETGVIARILTADHGIVAGYVAGGRGRAMRPTLIPGNEVAAELTARSASRMPFLKLELTRSRGPWMTEPLPAAAIQWTCVLTASALYERSPYPAIHAAMPPLLDAICHAPSARGWVRGLILYEALVLRELGYGGGAEPPQHDEWAGLFAAMDRSGALVHKHLLAERRGDVMAARRLLRERLARVE